MSDLLIMLNKQPTGALSYTLPVVESFAETEQTSDATSITIAKPSGTVDGDLLVAVIATGDGSTVSATPPAGWSTAVDNEANGALSFHCNLSVFYKVASSEGASYEFTYGATSRGAGHIIRISSASGTVTAGTATKDVDDTINVASITTQTDNSLVLNCFASCNSSRTESVSPTQGTLVAESKPASNSTCGFVYTYEQDVVTAGATTADSLTLNSSNGNVGIPVEITGATS